MRMKHTVQAAFGDCSNLHSLLIEAVLFLHTQSNVKPSVASAAGTVSGYRAGVSLPMPSPGSYLEVTALGIHRLTLGEPGDVGVPGSLLEGLLGRVLAEADQPGAAAVAQHKVELGQAVAHDLVCQAAESSHSLKRPGVDEAQHGCV